MEDGVEYLKKELENVNKNLKNSQNLDAIFNYKRSPHHTFKLGYTSSKRADTITHHEENPQSFINNNAEKPNPFVDLLKWSPHIAHNS